MIRESHKHLYSCCVPEKCLTIWKTSRYCASSQDDHFRHLISDIQNTHNHCIRSHSVPPIDVSKSPLFSSPLRSDGEVVVEVELDETESVNKRKENV
jgi:hypothetical protein